MRIDLANIQEYTSRGHQKALAFAVLVKSTFSNGKIYNWRKFDSSKFGLSKTTYFRYVNILSEQGHVSFEGNNLQMQCLYTIYTKAERIEQKRKYGTRLHNPIYRLNINDFRGKTTKEISLNLISNLFTEEYRKQTQLISLKIAANNNAKEASAEDALKSIDCKRKLMKLGFEANTETSQFDVDKNVRFRIDTLQKELQISKHTLYLLLQYMKTHKGLSIYNDIHCAGRYVEGMELQYKDKPFFVSKNRYLYICYSNIYYIKGVSIEGLEEGV